MKEGDFSNRDVETTKNEVDFWLEDYNDIFSDFDHRPYIERGLSGDFLEEAKRASQYKEEKDLKLKFFISKKLRKKEEERIIKRRLIEHFNRHNILLLKEKKKELIKGLTTTIVGLIVMVLVTTFFYKYQNISDTINTFIAISEISGWFLLWTGLNLVIFESRTLNPDLEFYKKMTKASISFYDN